MTAPRLQIDLAKLHHNARTLVDTLGRRGIGVTGVTKAMLGRADVADVLLRAGVRGLADARVENLSAMRGAGVSASMTLIRSPMLTQVDDVVRYADTSLNSEIDVIDALSRAARRVARPHGIVLMVELGDLREGIMPADLDDAVRHVLRSPRLELAGIGTNLACRSGVAPDARNMAALSALADHVETTFGLVLPRVSGGNSANLSWALSGADTGRIDDLRLGESILLGREPLHRAPLPGLHTDAITLVAEVIESKRKPSQPTGTLARSAFGDRPVTVDRGTVVQSILALGVQDVDPLGLQAPRGVRILGASSDHLVVSGEHRLPIGAELVFRLDYGALLRAMTSPFVRKRVTMCSAHEPPGAPALATAA